MSHVPSDECVMSPQINESCAHRWVSHIPTDEWVSIRCHELVLWHIATNLAYQHLTGTFHVTKMNESYPIETYCNTLQHTVTHCNTMYESYSIDGSSHVLNRIGSWRIESWHVATNSCCDTLPRTRVVTRCHELVLWHVATNLCCDPLPRTWHISISPATFMSPQMSESRAYTQIRHGTLSRTWRVSISVRTTACASNFWVLTNSNVVALRASFDFPNACTHTQKKWNLLVLKS